jgi:hypothetical protein
VHNQSGGAGASNPPFFFTVPAAESEPGAHPRPPLHAIACYRQLDSDQVRRRQAESPEAARVPASDGVGRITRNAVQKAVVLLCRLPVYTLQNHLSAAADSYAAAGFAAASLGNLMELLAKANASQLVGMPSPAMQLWLGVGGGDGGELELIKAQSAPAAAVYGPLDGGGGGDRGAWQPPAVPVPAFAQGSATAGALRGLGGRGLLRVVKALLLQRRVVFFGEPAGDVCAAVLGSAACLPCALEAVCPGAAGDDAMGGWANFGLPIRWLDGGIVRGFQPHATLQALGEVLDEGQSGGRLLGCSPNVARLLYARMGRASPGMRVDMLCDLSASKLGAREGARGDPGEREGIFDKRGFAFVDTALRRALALTTGERAFADRLQRWLEQRQDDMLLPADCGVGSAERAGRRRQAEHEAAETHLQRELHRYVAGLLTTAIAATPAAGYPEGVEVAEHRRQLHGCYGGEWSRLWQQSPAHILWLRRCQLRPGSPSWVDPSSVRPVELRTAVPRDGGLSRTVSGGVLGAVGGAGRWLGWAARAADAAAFSAISALTAQQHQYRDYEHSNQHQVAGHQMAGTPQPRGTALAAAYAQRAEAQTQAQERLEWVCWVWAEEAQVGDKASRLAAGQGLALGTRFFGRGGSRVVRLDEASLAVSRSGAEPVVVPIGGAKSSPVGAEDNGPDGPAGRRLRAAGRGRGAGGPTCGQPAASPF